MIGNSVCSRKNKASASWAIRADAGRLHLPTAGIPQSERVLLLSGDLCVLRRQIKLKGRAHTVVGGGPRGLHFPAPAELWVPAALNYAKKDSPTATSPSSAARVRGPVAP